MTRIIAAVCTILFLAAALPVVAQEAASAVPRLRYSVADDKVRVVLDLPAAATYTEQLTPTAATIRVATPLTTPLAPVTVTDPVVTSITVTADDAGQAVLTVAFAKARKCQVFTLPAADGKPFRLVVDVLKRFQRKETRSITPAITYIRQEEQTDTRYLATHVLEVNTRDPHVHLAVTAAQGERERVAAMVARTGAAAGVNGGYFLGGTRPVGLVKVDQQVISLPLWGRTAMAVPATGVPIFGNPTGVWRVTLPDGTTRDLPDALDASVRTPVPAAVVYAGSNHSLAPKVNANGVAACTVLVRGGVVAKRTAEAVPLVPGEFALQLKGEEAATWGATLTEGAAVTVTPVVTPAWADFPSAVGAGPRLLRDGQIAITGEAERFKPDILRGRAARTGLGVTRDGRVILAVVEDGDGMTLTELAALLRAHGAVDAMNLDGGGSSNLAIGSETVNYPPNTWIRPVATGVLVFDDRVTPAPPAAPAPASPGSTPEA